MAESALQLKLVKGPQAGSVTQSLHAALRLETMCATVTPDKIAGKLN
jgi:hypothetical protein